MDLSTAEILFSLLEGAPSAIQIGSRVKLRRNGVKGTVRHCGAVHFGVGDYIGLELDAPVGQHDGTVGGIIYFGAKPLHGSFVTPLDVDLLEGDAAMHPTGGRASSTRPPPPPLQNRFTTSGTRPAFVGRLVPPPGVKKQVTRDGSSRHNAAGGTGHDSAGSEGPGLGSPASSDALHARVGALPADAMPVTPDFSRPRRDQYDADVSPELFEAATIPDNRHTATDQGLQRRDSDNRSRGGDMASLLLRVEASARAELDAAAAQRARAPSTTSSHHTNTHARATEATTHLPVPSQASAGVSHRSNSESASTHAGGQRHPAVEDSQQLVAPKQDEAPRHPYSAVAPRSPSLSPGAKRRATMHASNWNATLRGGPSARFTEARLHHTQVEGGSGGDEHRVDTNFDTTTKGERGRGASMREGVLATRQREASPPPFSQTQPQTRPPYSSKATTPSASPAPYPTRRVTLNASQWNSTLRRGPGVRLAEQLPLHHTQIAAVGGEQARGGNGGGEEPEGEEGGGNGRRNSVRDSEEHTTSRGDSTPAATRTSRGLRSQSQAQRGRRPAPPQHPSSGAFVQARARLPARAFDGKASSAHRDRPVHSGTGIGTGGGVPSRRATLSDDDANAAEVENESTLSFGEHRPLRSAAATAPQSARKQAHYRAQSAPRPSRRAASTGPTRPRSTEQRGGYNSSESVKVQRDIPTSRMLHASPGVYGTRPSRGSNKEVEGGGDIGEGGAYTSPPLRVGAQYVTASGMASPYEAHDTLPPTVADEATSSLIRSRIFKPHTGAVQVKHAGGETLPHHERKVGVDSGSGSRTSATGWESGTPPRRDSGEKPPRSLSSFLELRRAATTAAAVASLGHEAVTPGQGVAYTASTSSSPAGSRVTSAPRSREASPPPSDHLQPLELMQRLRKQYAGQSLLASLVARAQTTKNSTLPLEMLVPPQASMQTPQVQAAAHSFSQRYPAATPQRDVGPLQQQSLPAPQPTSMSQAVTFVSDSYTSSAHTHTTATVVESSLSSKAEEQVVNDASRRSLISFTPQLTTAPHPRRAPPPPPPGTIHTSLTPGGGDDAAAPTAMASAGEAPTLLPADAAAARTRSPSDATTAAAVVLPAPQLIEAAVESLALTDQPLPPTNVLDNSLAAAVATALEASLVQQPTTSPALSAAKDVQGAVTAECTTIDVPGPVSQTLAEENSIPAAPGTTEDIEMNATETVVPHMCVIKSYAGICEQGYSSGQPDKPNQDVLVMVDDVESDTVMLAVFDGHGEDGHLISGTFRDRLAEMVFKHPKFQDVVPVADNIDPAALLAAKGSIKTSKRAPCGPSRPRRDAAGAITAALKACEALVLSDPSIDCSLSGCTGCVVLVTGSDVTVANVGDSRCVLVRGGASEGEADNALNLVPVAITVDHKPNLFSETKRILVKGGRIQAIKYSDGAEGPVRVWLRDDDVPGLAMSRSLGDTLGKKAGVISEPDIYQYTLTRADAFLVIASDGLWEFTPESDVAAVLAQTHVETAIAQAEYQQALAAAVASGGELPVEPVQHLQLVLDVLAEMGARNWQEREGVIDDTTVIVAEIGTVYQ